MAYMMRQVFNFFYVVTELLRNKEVRTEKKQEKILYLKQKRNKRV